ncbi:hypothetical protein BY458DRAFT_428718 [Sporodiniella umbellata]|nr:hypothetical protein BY458DRAFT_428718 [Sporodiniella umbellata]
MPDSVYQTRASLCVERVLERFGLAAGRIYAMVAFGGEKDKIRLEKMAKEIKEALSRRIQNATWLDSTTQASALKKLKKMATSVGYSTFFPDQRSPQDTLDFLKGLKTNHLTFYENERALARWRLDTYWKTFQQPINATAWIGVTTPQVVNAFNLLSQNSIFVSAGFAQPPNYDSHYPDYLNYGGIGQSMGHEYSHGFDDLGAQYDEFGVERNWWSKRTHALYEQKAQCFVDTYSKASIKDRKGRNHFIDGTLTLGESIADHEGLSAAYDAYQTSKSNPKAYNPILPGLNQFSHDALFFISAARSFCSKSSLDANKDWLLDEHAPDSVRLNMMLKNSPEFSKIFKCPLGSPMNPREIKCHIW